MGFRQKSRGVRIGRWELLAFLLAGTTVLCAAVWWHARNTTVWKSAPAEIVGLSLEENTDAISASRPHPRIHYTYVIEGRIYHGSAALDTVIQVLYAPVPAEVLKFLHAHDYESFGDLPPALQTLLRQHGITDLHSAPEPVLKTLRAQGFKSVQDFPDDLRQLARAGDYATLAERAAQLLGTPATLETLGELPGEDVAAVEGGEIRILYDPYDPGRSQVLRIPGMQWFQGPLMFLLSALVTLLYCGVAYPRIKRQ